MGLVRRTCSLGAAVSLLGVVWAVSGSGTPAVAAPPPVPVPGTGPTLVQGATDLGVATAQPLTVTLSLPLRNQTGLTGLIAGLTNPSSPNYHQFLTPAAFASQFSPTSDTVNAVTGWAWSAGLTVTSVSSNRTLVTVNGTASQLGNAFGVTFHSYRMTNGQTFISNSQAATVPAALAGDVSSIVGLSTLGQLQLAPVAAPTGTPSFPSSYGPKDFWSLYNAPANQTGAGQTIAVLAEGDLTSPRSDLATFEQTYGLPTVPWTTIPTGAASTDTSGNDEWDLDTQYSTGLAGNLTATGSGMLKGVVFHADLGWVNSMLKLGALSMAGDGSVTFNAELLHAQVTRLDGTFLPDNADLRIGSDFQATGITGRVDFTMARNPPEGSH